MTIEDRETVSIENFIEIPVGLPPVLMNMIGYQANARYVALYYYGNKATWNDGLALSTFSYYSVYEPLRNHPAMAVHLFDSHLGSDDEYPTHALLCDREGRKFYVGEYEQVLKFLHQQRGVGPSAEVIAEYERVTSQPRTSADFNRLGMFELFTQPDERAQRDTASLLCWLDSFITEELFKKLVEMLEGHDLRAWQPIWYIQRLVEAQSQNQSESAESA